MYCYVNTLIRLFIQAAKSRSPVLSQRMAYAQVVAYFPSSNGVSKVWLRENWGEISRPAPAKQSFSDVFGRRDAPKARFSCVKRASLTRGVWGEKTTVGFSYNEFVLTGSSNNVTRGQKFFDTSAHILNLMPHFPECRNFVIFKKIQTPLLCVLQLRHGSSSNGKLPLL